MNKQMDTHSWAVQWVANIQLKSSHYRNFTNWIGHSIQNKKQDDVKINVRNKNETLQCDLCKNEIGSQRHMLEKKFWKRWRMCQTTQIWWDMRIKC